MTITLANLRGYVEHALGGSDLESPIPGASADLRAEEVINRAGQWFVSHHSWNFRLRPPTTVNWVADQAYADLPSDFGEMIGYQMTNGLNYGITLTTPQELASYRASTVTVTQNQYWATFSWPTQSAVTSGQGVPRLELWPTPSSNLTGALTLWYRAAWTVLDDDTDAANVPDFAEFALALACRAFATGISEEHVRERDTESELDKLVNGHIFRAAYTQDGLIQPDYGPIKGGAIEQMYPRFSWRSASAGPVADPS